MLSVPLKRVYSVCNVRATSFSKQSVRLFQGTLAQDDDLDKVDVNIRELLRNNRKWVMQTNTRDPTFFEKLGRGQAPKYLYIGCSDSRVPSSRIMGVSPGEVFVHRNIGNQVPGNDLNVLSVLEFAVGHLGVTDIIVTGHYACGAVKAATSRQDLGTLENWLRLIRDVYRLHKDVLDSIASISAAATEVRKFKIIVLGDKEVGKSSLARSQLEAIAAKFVDPDSQAIVYPTKFEMNVGTVEFDIWDLWLEHSEEVRETILPAYYAGAHAAVLMFDFTSRESYRNIAEWYRVVRQACGDIPIIICGNKFDINEDVIPPKSIHFHRKRNLPYLRISTKYSYNIDKLFWRLATLFIANGEEEVQFVQPPSLSVSGGMNFLNPTAEHSWLPPSNDEDEDF